MVSQYVKGGKMQNFDIATENFGVEGTMLIPQGRILKKLLSIYEINLKKTRSKVSQLWILTRLRVASNFRPVRPSYALKAFAGTFRVIPAYEAPSFYVWGFYDCLTNCSVDRFKILLLFVDACFFFVYLLF